MKPRSKQNDGLNGQRIGQRHVNGAATNLKVRRREETEGKLSI